MSGTEPEPDTSISHLTDLPAPILDHIVSFLDSAWDRKQLRKVARALVEPAERAATSLTLTRGNLARLWPGRFPACRHVAVTLSVASSFIDAPVAAAWLCDLPALESVEVQRHAARTPAALCLPSSQPHGPSPAIEGVIAVIPYACYAGDLLH